LVAPASFAERVTQAMCEGCARRRLQRDEAARSPSSVTPGLDLGAQAKTFAISLASSTILYAWLKAAHDRREGCERKRPLTGLRPVVTPGLDPGG
jgi:hypothetical protein